MRDAEALGLLMGPGECNYYAKKTAMSKIIQKDQVESWLAISKHNKTIYRDVHCSIVYSSKIINYIVYKGKIYNSKKNSDHQYETG